MELIYAQLGAGGIAVAVTRATGVLTGDRLVQLAAYDTALIGKRYDAANDTWHDVETQPSVVEGHRVVSVLAFRRRFTRAERGAIEWAAVDRADQPEAQRRQAAELRASLADQAAATFIDLDDAGTVAGVQALVAMGLLTLARAAAILGTAVQPEERP